MCSTINRKTKDIIVKDNQVIIRYSIIRNTDINKPRITYFVRVIPEENTEDLYGFYIVLYSDPIIPCEIEIKAEQALKRQLRKHGKYQNSEIIFKRDNKKGNAISGIEDIGFEWHVTRKSNWDEKSQELDRFFLYVQYRFKENPSYMVCKTLKIKPCPLKSERPVLIQFETEPIYANLITRDILKKTLLVENTSLNEWKKKHILVSRAGYGRKVFYYVAHINQAFEKRFESTKPEDKRWYKKLYKHLRYYYGN